jgi:hypothetical protein
MTAFYVQEKQAINFMDLSKDFLKTVDFGCWAAGKGCHHNLDSVSVKA